MGQATSAADLRSARTKSFVAELLIELPVPPLNAKFASAATTRKRKLSTIASRCGSRLVRASLLKAVEVEFVAAGIYTHRLLSSPALKRNDRIKLSRLLFAPDELFFDNEQLLKEVCEACDRRRSLVPAATHAA
jgi:hypothetical protein